MNHVHRAYSGNLGNFRSDFAKHLLVIGLIKSYFTLERELYLYQRDIVSCTEIETELANNGADAERLAKAKAVSNDAREAYERKKREFVMMKQDISDLIDKVNDITSRTLLKVRILERKKSAEAAKIIHYSTATTTRLYMVALTELDRLYQNQNEHK